MTQMNLFEEEKEEKTKPKWIKDEEGFFMLDRVKVNYKFEADKYGVSHLEFISDEDKKPNLISETGFRSWFINWDLTESVVNSVQQLIEMYLKELLKDKPNYTLDFEGKEIEEVEVEDSDSAWNDIHKISKRCEKEDKPYSYAFVQYNCKNDLNGKEEWVSISTSLNRRRGELGSSSGGWVTFKTKEDIEKFKEELLWVRKSVCEKPYIEDCCVNGGGGSDTFLTDINIENTMVSFGKKAREFVEKNGFSVDDFYKEFNALKQIPATKEDIKKSTTFKLMEKQVDRIRDECWAIKGYFDEYSFLPTGNRNKSNYYTKKCNELKFDTSDLNKLRDLYIQKAKMYKILYKKVYFQRWGKETDDEYSYP